MKKIYYIEEKTTVEKTEVHLGETMEWEGLQIILTQEIVDLNPDKFEVIEETRYWEFIMGNTSTTFTIGKIYKLNENKNIEDFSAFTNDKGDSDGWNRRNRSHFKPSTKEAYEEQIRNELLEEAKKRYPKGTRFKDCNAYCTSKKVDIVNTLKINPLIDKIGIYSDPYNIYGAKYVYFDGEWAEIIKPIFKTEDGVDVYEGDTVYYSYKTNLCCCRAIITENFSTTYNVKNMVLFSTKEATEEYIEQNKPKDLKYYEDKLLHNIEYLDNSCFGTNFKNISYTKGSFYGSMKFNEPKLYWIKVMNLIAEDVNKKYESSKDYRFEIYSNDYSSYKTTSSYINQKWGFAIFNSKEACQEAIDILGDNVKYLFDEN